MKKSGLLVIQSELLLLCSSCVSDTSPQEDSILTLWVLSETNLNSCYFSTNASFFCSFCCWWCCLKNFPVLAGTKNITQMLSIYKFLFVYILIKLMSDSCATDAADVGICLENQGWWNYQLASDIFQYNSRILHLYLSYQVENKWFSVVTELGSKIRFIGINITIAASRQAKVPKSIVQIFNFEVIRAVDIKLNLQI